ncbi:MAG: GNAT family N-acetyltransferase [Bacteroidota bacterium]
MISEITEKEQWDKILLEIGKYDCYHTFEYHNICSEVGNTPILLEYRSKNLLIALPLILRPIEGTDYFDFTSVYGYPGPIHNGKLTEEARLTFQESLTSYFFDKKVVSVFSRLNPFIGEQESTLENLGTIEYLGDVVNIDLTKDIELQRQLFSKTTKRYLNKTRRLCYTKKSNDLDDIQVFMDLYYENMDRVNAKKLYYFDKDYFVKLANSQTFKTEIIYAVLQETDEIISAAMMFKTNDIVQYHISGTKNDYLHMTPIRLLLDETRIDGSNEGFTFFNLGGGLGSEEDSLFQFKASFSKDFKAFKVWKHIVDETVYETLVKEKEIQDTGTNFFPKYRHS